MEPGSRAMVCMRRKEPTMSRFRRLVLVASLLGVGLIPISPVWAVEGVSRQERQALQEQKRVLKHQRQRAKRLVRRLRIEQKQLVRRERQAQGVLREEGRPR